MMTSAPRCGWFYQLQIIGEACGRLSDDFRARHPEMPWRAITGMRHHLVHGYFDIDPDIGWVAVTERIPQLKNQIQAALSRLDVPLT